MPYRIPQNISGNSLLRHLLKVELPVELDLAAQPGPAISFETAAAARTYCDRLVERLDDCGLHSDLTQRLSDCSCPSPCCSTNCPLCARLFRRWFAAQGLRIARSHETVVVSINIEKCSALGLAKLDLRNLVSNCRQHIRRAIPDLEFALGGIEAEYLADEDQFLLHVHMQMPRPTRKQEAALRSAFKRSEVSRAVKIQAMKDIQSQVPYLLKFVTYHRPGRQIGPHHARAMPLPLHALEALTSWRDRHGFLDFVFAIGMRRVGDRYQMIKRMD